MSVKQKKIVLVFGTRPEAIKMAPLYRELKSDKKLKTKVLVTAQHREMLDQVLSLFQITPTWDLNLMKHRQDLTYVTTACLKGVEKILKHEKPDLVLVHGDTTTTFAAALAAYYLKIPVGHVEAGLRTQDKHRPFPEEMNRRLGDAICDLHFAPTETARRNLVAENISEKGIFVTGNTVIDALYQILRLARKTTPFVQEVRKKGSGKKIVVVTAHRRENFGKAMKEIAHAVFDLAEKCKEIFVVFSVHKNPEARQPLQKMEHPRVMKVEPLPFLEFVQLMNLSTFLLTDSGGLQEEGPALNKPVLVMREVTERPEAIKAGVAKLVGTRRETIFASALHLLKNKRAYERMCRARNPYGDGQASRRIHQALNYYFGYRKHPPKNFTP